MKIIQVSPGDARIPTGKPGGITGHIVAMSRSLSKMGHEVLVLDRQYSNTDPSKEFLDGFKIVRLRARLTNFRFSPKLPKIRSFYYSLASVVNGVLFHLAINKHLKKEDSFDAINVYGILGLIFTIFGKRWRGKVYYTHVSSHWPPYPKNNAGRFYRLITCYMIKRCNTIIVQNESLYNYMRAEKKLAQSNIVLIPPGVDLSLYNSPVNNISRIKTKYGVNNKKLILTVGRICTEKGILDLVKTAHIIINNFNYKDILFLVVGPHEKYDECKGPSGYLHDIYKLIADNRLEDYIKLTDFVTLDDLVQLYSSCDVFLLPSLCETFGQCMTEAMASARPVVTTRTHGGLMQVHDKENGFLVDIGNPSQLAEKIRFLLDNPEDAKIMGDNARKSSMEYDWLKICERYLKSYDAGGSSK